MRAVAHIASVITYDKDPNNVINRSVAGAVNALKAAASPDFYGQANAPGVHWKIIASINAVPQHAVKPMLE
jgi:hypothetical protein